MVDTPAPLDFKAIFKDFIAANEKEWGHNRDKSVGASEIFACLRHVWFRKYGKDNDIHIDEDYEDDWGAKKRGDLLEEHFVVPAVRDHLPVYAKLLYAGKQQKTLFHGNNSGTPDGLIVNLPSNALANYGVEDIGPSGSVVFEIKSIDPRVNLDVEKDIHFGQVQTQMGLIREKTEHKPDYAVLIYVDASFLSRIKIFIVEYNEVVWQVAQKRADRIFAATSPEQLETEGKINNECQHCMFTEACSIATIGTIPEDKSKDKVLKLRIAEIEPAVLKFKKAGIDKKNAEAEYEAASIDLKDSLTKFGSRKIANKGHWNVTWYSQAGARNLDKDALMAALGVEDLDDFKKQGSPFNVLRVTFTADNTEGAIETY